MVDKSKKCRYNLPGIERVRLSYYAHSLPLFFFLKKNNYERDGNLHFEMKENRGHGPFQMKEKPGTGR